MVFNYHMILLSTVALVLLAQERQGVVMAAASGFHPSHLREQPSYLIGSSQQSDFTNTLILGAPVSLDITDSYRKLFIFVFGACMLLIILRCWMLLFVF